MPLCLTFVFFSGSSAGLQQVDKLNRGYDEGTRPHAMSLPAAQPH